MSRKSILSIIMTLALLSVLSFSAFAADDSGMKISVSSADVKAGDSVSIDVTIDRNPGVFGFTAEVDYDADSFAFDKSEVQGVFSNDEVIVNNIADGRITISATDSGVDNKTETGKFVKITFKTTADSVNGEHKIKIKQYNDTSKKISGEAIQSIDEAPYSKVIPVEYIGGTITLSGGSDKQASSVSSNDEGGFQPWIIVVAVAAVLVVLVVILFVTQNKKGKKPQNIAENSENDSENSEKSDK